MRVNPLIASLSYCIVPVLAKSVDYVIIGAGTSGLVVANRLSEDPSVTVVVIEPGTDQRDNPIVSDPGRFNEAQGTALDWSYKIVDQPGADGRGLELHQGKAWGGTSTINGMTYIRGDGALFDAWEDLGNPGWNWESMLPYFKKSESYTIPTDAQAAAGASYAPEVHGFDGPVRVGYPSDLANGTFSSALVETWEGLSIAHIQDLNSGGVRGFNIGPQTMNTELNIRWDAARAYLHPAETRPNLEVIQGTVRKITWASSKCSHSKLLVANGVEYLTPEGGAETVVAKREVIVSAGAQLGIEVKVNLPGVGENLVEQTNHIIGYSGTLDSSASAFHAFFTAKELFGSEYAEIESWTRQSIPTWAAAIVEASGEGALTQNAVEKLLTVQADLLFKHNVAAAEILTIGLNQFFGSNYWGLFPFSRGSVHLASVEDIDAPAIDPRFFMADFDAKATVAAGRLAEKFWNSAPINASMAGRILPDSDVLPEDASDDQWEAFHRSQFSANSHPLGSASMMARELGGVVDHELRVYGTANVRVVDASILPTQISGHLTAVLYGVAERASDLIKQVSW
ncbi:hypothetical protein jhhlp_008868 [Lomentospora prolificans]|uniref:Glucose-methanol-choline oxidoreductase N-terminal domain-containing protein n=1 Tax=Lomentospora prolificans TaxID=41688 RepID=A0A2N3MZ97_9PEZI|nr:hypothetical protein jhhlp_008868 [Lomentospora prolificans]